MTPLALLASLLLAAGPATPAPPPPPAVTGFALAGTGPGVIAASAKALTTVTVDGVTLRTDGASVPAPSSAARRTLAAAHARGLRAEILVSNYSERLGDFDPGAAHRLLADAEHRADVVEELATAVTDGGFDGVNVDLELVPARDADGLTAFVTELRDALPEAASVSIDVSASTSAAGYRDGGYDLAGLAAPGAADVVQLMAYDQHGPGWSGPGPIGDLRWQRRALAAALDVVPADRLDLGVGGYGYTWSHPDRAGSRWTGRTVTDRGARSRVHRAGVRAHWHPRAGEWSATLPGPRGGTRTTTTMWWSDARSYRLRVALAQRLHLHGVAVWRLGSADALRP